MSKFIELTRNKVAIVDDEDYEYLNQWKWYCSSDGYAVRGTYVKGKRVEISMARLVNKTPNGIEVDHKDLNKLNDTKGNLRNCTRNKNQANRKKLKTNTSGYKGVCWHKREKKWIVSIHRDGRLLHLGYFKIKEEAAKAYNKAAQELSGEFAYLNQI